MTFALTVQGPPRAQDTYPVVRSNDDGTYTAQFLPLQTGTYTLSVRSPAGGMLVTAPFSMLVTSGAVEPSRTVVDGDGLSGGVVGQELSVQVSASPLATSIRGWEGAGI